ncbi:hypothetical protein KQX54_000328 [Cotesia glomerata]|uniref:Uncharacterized protein n=1 Tax=Cotesia glomerata TaxID=32391 RepID=A0AAV7HVW3_COTGL|nr:hypothetical protein KQX54_000328 [Cotesia glomerata]
MNITKESKTCKMACNGLAMNSLNFGFGSPFGESVADGWISQESTTFRVLQCMLTSAFHFIIKSFANNLEQLDFI